MRMLVIWLPRWKCSSLRQSSMPRALRYSSAAHDLGDRQAELRSEAAGRLPAAAAARGELHAHADLRPDAGFLGVFDDQLQLGEFLDDRDDVAADLLGEHRRLDELGVLEAVADDRRVVVGDGHDGEQFRLRAGFEAEAVRPAEVEDLLDHVPLLVDLDRIDAAVAALVLVLADGAPESRRGCRRRDA